MLRRLLFLSVGALALLVVLGAPGQVHAQRMRGGFRPMVHPGFRGGFMPGFRGGFNPGFFAPHFNRFENRFGFGRFDRFEDRFERRFNRGSFDPRFNWQLGGGLATFGALGSNLYGNLFAMPYFNMYGGGYGAGAGYGGGGGAYGAGTGDYGLNTYASWPTAPPSDSQVEVPHRTGDVTVAPANAAVIRLQLPDEFAAVSFNGQNVSSIGANRTYVTPDLEAGKSLRYQIKVTWGTGNQQTSLERVVEAWAGQISTVDFTRVNSGAAR